jgi:type IV pilus assembly protein PilC
MRFSYQARTKSGLLKQGVLNANSKVAAIDMLHKNKLFPITIEEADGGKKGLNTEIKIFEGVSSKDIVLFTRELAIMIESNVPPAKSLDALAEQTRNKTFKEKILKVASDIREGLTLSKALSRHPKIFSSFYVNMVKSGEISGTLPNVLNKVAAHLENEYAIRSKTIGAMIYPIVVLVIFAVIFVVVVVCIIPGMVEVLEDSGSELPLVTQIVIGVSDFFVNFWWVILIGVIGIISFGAYYLKTKEGKDLLDRFLVDVPIFGPFQRNVYMNRFAENLSTLISSGKNITEALEVTGELIGNNVYKDIILETRDKVIKGEKISDVLATHPKYISPLFVQMVAVGEDTGRLSETLLNVVSFYKREIEIFVDSLSSIIEPVLIIGLAGMVGILVAAVFLPLYQIGGTIG